jgi:hypothetical protein
LNSPTRQLRVRSAEQSFQIAPAVYHAQNQHLVILYTINYDVLPNRKAPQANAKIVVARAAKIGVAGEKGKPVSDGINQVVCDVDAATFPGDVVPSKSAAACDARRWAISEALIRRRPGGFGRAV